MHSPCFVSVATPRAICAFLACLIAEDVASGEARLLPAQDHIVFGRGADVVATPDETLARGSGNSADLVRLVGAAEGDEVGCVTLPSGALHCFLRRKGEILDPSTARGYPSQPPAFYAAASYAPLQRVPLERRPQGLPPPAIRVGEPPPGGAKPLPIFNDLLAACATEIPGALPGLTEVALALGRFRDEVASSSLEEGLAAFQAWVEQHHPLDPARAGNPTPPQLALVTLHVVLFEPEELEELLAQGDAPTGAALALAQLVIEDLVSVDDVGGFPMRALPESAMGGDDLPSLPPGYRPPPSFREAAVGRPPGCSGGCGTPW